MSSPASSSVHACLPATRRKALIRLVSSLSALLCAAGGPLWRVSWSNGGEPGFWPPTVCAPSRDPPRLAASEPWHPRDRDVGEEHVAEHVTANYPRHLAVKGPTQDVQAWEHAWWWVSPGIILQFHRLGTRPLLGHICQAQGTDLPQHSWSSYQAGF